MNYLWLYLPSPNVQGPIYTRDGILWLHRISSLNNKISFLNFINNMIEDFCISPTSLLFVSLRLIFMFFLSHGATI